MASHGLSYRKEINFCQTALLISDSKRATIHQQVARASERYILPYGLPQHRKFKFYTMLISHLRSTLRLRRDPSLVPHEHGRPLVVAETVTRLSRPQACLEESALPDLHYMLTAEQFRTSV